MVSSCFGLRCRLRTFEEPYLDPFSQQWVAPGQFNQQNGLFTMLMMQLIRQKDPAVDNMLNMGKFKDYRKLLRKF